MSSDRQRFRPTERATQPQAKIGIHPVGCTYQVDDLRPFREITTLDSKASEGDLTVRTFVTYACWLDDDPVTAKTAIRKTVEVVKTDAAGDAVSIETTNYKTKSAWAARTTAVYVPYNLDLDPTQPT